MSSEGGKDPSEGDPGATADSGNEAASDAERTDDAAAAAGTADPAGSESGGLASRLPEPGDLSRRQLLGLVAGAGVAGAAGVTLLDSPPEPASTEPVDAAESQRLAESYAPRLYFESREQWFPTDPGGLMPAGESASPATEPGTPGTDDTSDDSGGTVLSGFQALNEYTRRFDAEGLPPDPTVFYHARAYPDSPLAVVQFWMYSAFDQFSTNFHWHDWEVLHVYVDRDASAPVLFVASAHSRRVPNNEYFNPETDRASIISELGSHSSALGVNERESSFQRFPQGDLLADITNKAVKVLSGQSGLPLAYGLPRDENTALPYAVPELDGAPVWEHPKLPDVTAGDLVPDDVLVRSFAALSSPPDLPTRETGTMFAAASDVAADPDVEYELAPIREVRGLDDLTGPQLSFEFAVPKFAENQFAAHITTTGVPWDQERFLRPTADISDPVHRRKLAARYDPIRAPSEGPTVVASLRQLVTSEDAPDGNGTATATMSVGGVVQLRSEATASATFAGDVFALRDVPPGDHQLTVNAPGVAPYSQRATVPESAGIGVGTATGTGTATPTDSAADMPTDSPTASPTPSDGSTETPTASPTATATESPTTATATPTDPNAPVRLGADGVVAAPANEDAVKLRSEVDGASRVVLDDDFAGRVVDGKPLEEGRVGMYAHRDGAYTAELVADDGAGVARINPNADDDEVTARPGKGKSSFAEYLLRTLVETRLQAEAFQEGAVNDVPTGQGIDRDVIGNVVDTARQEAGGGSSSETDTDTDDDGPGESETNGKPTDSPTPTDTTRETASDTPTKTATPTATDTPTETATGTDPPSNGGGGAANGLLTALSAGVLVAARADDAARAGNPTAADRRLERLRTRLDAIANALERSGADPELAKLVANRMAVLAGRIDAAVQQDL